MIAEVEDGCVPWLGQPEGRANLSVGRLVGLSECLTPQYSKGLMSEEDFAVEVAMDN